MKYILIALIVTLSLSGCSIEEAPVEEKTKALEPIISTIIDTTIDSLITSSKAKENDREVVKSPAADCENCLSDLLKGTKNRIPVDYDYAMDGDTAQFIIKERGKSEEIRVRFLLIDTPELSGKHAPQPFAQEAKDLTHKLLSQAKQVYIETDVGNKQDKYQRYLAYVYADDTLVQEELVEQGLAKVAYVFPPNTRYLDELESKQVIAKEGGLNIWK